MAARADDIIAVLTIAFPELDDDDKRSVTGEWKSRGYEAALVLPWDRLNFQSEAASVARKRRSIDVGNLATHLHIERMLWLRKNGFDNDDMFVDAAMAGVSLSHEDDKRMGTVLPTPPVAKLIRRTLNEIDAIARGEKRDVRKRTFTHLVSRLRDRDRMVRAATV